METPKTILIIDDEANFREIFSTKLASAGHRIETAGGGEEGVKKVKELQPDLVLLDEKMPDMDGGEVLMKLRQDLSTSRIKVVFLTNLGDPRDGGTDDRLAAQFGADGYIKKTEDLDHLVVLVNEFLKK